MFDTESEPMTMRVKKIRHLHCKQTAPLRANSLTPIIRNQPDNNKDKRNGTFTGRDARIRALIVHFVCLGTTPIQGRLLKTLLSILFGPQGGLVQHYYVEQTGSSSPAA